MAEGSFAQDLERLEAIVRRLESGELDLDDALKLFEEGVERLRAGAPAGERVSLVYNFPPSISAASAVRPAMLYLAQAERDGVFRDARLVQGPQFVGVDGVSELADAAILAHVRQFVEERLRVSELHPDAWAPILIRDPGKTREQLLAIAGDKDAIAIERERPSTGNRDLPG